MSMGSNLGGVGLQPVAGGAVSNLNPSTSGGTVAGVASHRWLLGIKIYMQAGLQAVANDYIRTDNLIYEGTCIAEGFAERSIPAPSGPPRVGDCRFRLDDTDRRWRTILSTHTGMRRLIEFVRIVDGEFIGGYEITKVYFGDGWVEIAGKDILSKIFDKPFPNRINRTNFPWLIEGVDEDFMPKVWGHVFSSAENPQGRIRCPHMGPTTKATGSVTVDRYCASEYNASHTVAGVNYPLPYRRNPGESSFTVVDPSEFVVTTDELLTDAFGSTYPTYIDFLTEQDPRAEVRCDSVGSNSSLNSIGTGTIAQPATDANPIDFLSYVFINDAQALGGTIPGDRFNESNWAALRAQFASNSWRCDGVIDTPITLGNFIARLCTSFEFHFFINRRYQYDVRMNLDEDTGRPELTNIFDLLDFQPSTPDEAFNRWHYRFARNAATGQWAGSETYDILADQAELGGVDYQGNADVVELQNVDLYYVDDPDTALATIVRRSNYERLGSHIVDISVSLPEWFDVLDLGTPFGVTDPFGIGPTGWDNVEFELISRHDDYENLRLNGRGIRRVPEEY